jgi:hypothetical protein
MADASKMAPATIEEALAGLPPDFQFFANRFSSVIQPKLLEREADRVAAIKRQQMFTLYGVLAGLAVGAGGYVIFKEWFGFLIGAFLGFGVYAWGSMAINKLATETKLMLIEPVSSEFGMELRVKFGGWFKARDDFQIFNCFGCLVILQRQRGIDNGQPEMRNECVFRIFGAHFAEKFFGFFDKIAQNQS